MAMAMAILASDAFPVSFLRGVNILVDVVGGRYDACVHSI